MSLSSDGPVDPLIGNRIGRYVIREQLAVGGMGAVYVAEHERLENTKKVVKVLLGEHAKNETIRARFEREATAVSKLRHKHIITIDDFGALADGTPFLIMPFLEGKPLDAYIREHGRFTAHRTLHIVIQICSALQHAHQHGIVHRDLKPGNIFITATDDNPYRVTLIDLGIARDLEANDLKTHTGTTMGTPGYMAVEQYGDAAMASPLADLYSTAIVAWELLTGVLPWGLSDPRVLYHKQMTEAPPAPPAGTIPPAWEAILRSALAVAPAHRPPTIRAFAVALASSTPGIPPHVPSGGEMLASLAKDLVDKAPPMIETVRGAGGEAPPAAAMMWPPRETQHVATPPPRARGPSRPPGSAPSIDLVATQRTAKPPFGAEVAAASSRYKLGAKLGAGGMAEVFAATAVGAEGFARPVAIKRVLAGYSSEPQFGAMFIEEARIASRLNHPNVIGVLDFDHDSEGRLFLAMELVEGMDLSKVMASGELPIGVAIFVASEALRGLGYAHQIHDASSGRRGVIHRDVSPHNVLVSWEGAVKVSDFGLAKALDADGGAATRQVKGHVAYMSPEQANSETLDPRSDLFALGVVLYEMLTGAPLFRGDTQAVLAQIFFKEIPPPSALRRAVPPDLDSVVMALLARDREGRFVAAEAAIEALSRCRDAPTNGRGELARLLAERFPRAVRAYTGREPEMRAAEQFTAPVPALTYHGGVGGMSGTVPPTAMTQPVRRWPIVAGIAVSLLVGGAVAAVLLGRGAPSAPVVGAAAAPAADATAAALPPPLPPDAAAAPLPPPPDVAAAPLPPPPDAAAAAAAAPPDAAAAPPPLPPHLPPAHAPRPPPVTSPPPHAAKSESGSLAIYVKPWAQVWVNDKPAGSTPYTATLPVGRYRVRLANEDLGKTETTTVVVVAGKTETLQRQW